MMFKVSYTEYAGCAITRDISVKFGTVHGRSRPEVGSAKRIDVYESGGVSRPSLVPGNYQQKIVAKTDLLRAIHDFYSITVCN